MSFKASLLFVVYLSIHSFLSHLTMFYQLQYLCNI